MMQYQKGIFLVFLILSSYFIIISKACPQFIIENCSNEQIKEYCTPPCIHCTNCP